MTSIVAIYLRRLREKRPTVMNNSKETELEVEHNHLHAHHYLSPCLILQWVGSTGRASYWGGVRMCVCRWMGGDCGRDLGMEHGSSDSSVRGNTD